MNVFELVLQILIIIILIIIVIAIIIGSLIYSGNKKCMTTLTRIFDTQEKHTQCFLDSLIQHNIKPSVYKKLCKCKTSKDFVDFLMETKEDDYFKITKAMDKCLIKKFWL